MVAVSREFRAALKLHALPAYRIAQRAGVNPVTLSRLINGIEPVRENDPRILAVAEVLGIDPEDVFESEEDGQ
jgi:transcriptional regulator with XRE-family HTH domain